MKNGKHKKFPNDFVNKIVCGDCLETMRQMPDNYVDLVGKLTWNNLTK